VGGGLYADAGAVSVEYTSITGNQALGGGHAGTDGQGRGGGIYLAGGTVSVKKTEIWGNHASTSDDDVFGDLIDA